jgi:general secretion pathway protein B
LLVIGLAIGWWQPWQRATTPNGLDARPGAIPATPAPSTELPAKPATSVKADAEAVVRHAEVKEPAPAMPSPSAEAPSAPAASIKPPVQPSQETASRNAAQSVETVAEAVAPAAIQQEIPAIAISLHSYSSNPKERAAMINGRMLREGDEIGPGLRLERIVPEGVVLGYKGYQIPRGLRQ